MVSFLVPSLAKCPIPSQVARLGGGGPGSDRGSRSVELRTGAPMTGRGKEGERDRFRGPESTLGRHSLTLVPSC